MGFMEIVEEGSGVLTELEEFLVAEGEIGLENWTL